MTLRVFYDLPEESYYHYYVDVEVLTMNMNYD